MCCCEKPNVNGQPGYCWNPDRNGEVHSGVHPVNPPPLQEGDDLISDDPGRCGGQDSHSFHYRVVLHCSGGASLLVRHGGGDEKYRLANPNAVVVAIAKLDSDSRYWILNAMYHALSNARQDARHSEAARWRLAAAEKRIKLRKRHGSVRVEIEPRPIQTGEQV